jgi:sortase A
MKLKIRRERMDDTTGEQGDRSLQTVRDVAIAPDAPTEPVSAVPLHPLVVDRPGAAPPGEEGESPAALFGGLAAPEIPVADEVSPATDGETPAPDAASAPARRSGTVLLRVGVVATTVGLCVLLFFVYAYWFTGLQEARHQHMLLNEFTTPARGSLLSGKVPAPGQPAAVLEIPAIHLDQVVVQGSTATDLMQGPGLMPGTARPGSLGNAVIAGRRQFAGGPFSDIGQLRPGDRILVVTGLGRYSYAVQKTGKALPGAANPEAPDRHPVLTLVTANGIPPDGLVYARAKLVSAPNRAPVPRQPPAVYERGLTGDPAAVVPTILTGLLLALGFAVAFVVYARLPKRRWVIYLLTTPVLLALTLLWYSNLIRLLPATL